MTTLDVEHYPPSRDQQARKALDRANRVRLSRCALKRDIAAGLQRLGPLVHDPPAYAEGMFIFDAVRSVKQVGPKTAPRIVQSLGIPQTKTFGSLTDRQRHEIVGILRDRYGIT